MNQTFFKAKRSLSKYWTSIKMKISMTCVQRLWRWNKNGTRAMNTAKNDIVIGL